ncbi:MAG: hypothetical protein LBQ93_00720 [Treponema sp.]|jgi:hypothetical protein|nr:hypothetical protein [Treponema sp.]
MKIEKIRNTPIRISSAIILFFILAFNVFLLSTFQERNEYEIIGYFMAIFFQLIVCTFFIILFLEDCVENSTKKRVGLSILVNLLFSTSSIMFIFNDKYLSKTWFQLLSPLVLLLMLYFINKFTKIKKGDDVSLLKSTNFFMASIYMASIFFLENHYNNVNLKFFVNYYYLLPILMLQGLYEIFDRKSR